MAVSEEVRVNRYADVPFDEIRAALVGGFRRENVAALRSSAALLAHHFTLQPCDDVGVAGCIRCNVTFLALLVTEALEGVETVPEAADAYLTAKATQTPENPHG